MTVFMLYLKFMPTSKVNGCNKDTPFLVYIHVSIYFVGWKKLSLFLQNIIMAFTVFTLHGQGLIKF